MAMILCHVSAHERARQVAEHEDIVYLFPSLEASAMKDGAGGGLDVESRLEWLKVRPALMETRCTICYRSLHSHSTTGGVANKKGKFSCVG